MNKLTLCDLLNGVKLSITPDNEGENLYFHAFFKNVPYFLIAEFSEKEYDTNTLISIASPSKEISKKIADKFRKYIYSILPKFDGWNDTIIYYETTHVSGNNILRIDLELRWCELSK